MLLLNIIVIVLGLYPSQKFVFNDWVQDQNDSRSLIESKFCISWLSRGSKRKIELMWCIK